MHALEIRAVRALRNKIFANMASIESFCGHLRREMDEAGMVEAEELTDRELAQTVQQWLSVGDNAIDLDAVRSAPEDIAESFAVLAGACRSFLGPDFTLEDEKALESLATYLQRRLPTGDPAADFARQHPDAIPTGRTVIQKGFWGRFWEAFTSA